jgi:hypothetical protein
VTEYPGSCWATDARAWQAALGDLLAYEEAAARMKLQLRWREEEAAGLRLQIQQLKSTWVSSGGGNPLSVQCRRSTAVGGSAVLAGSPPSDLARENGALKTGVGSGVRRDAGGPAGPRPFSSHQTVDWWTSGF